MERSTASKVIGYHLDGDPAFVRSRAGSYWVFGPLSFVILGLFLLLAPLHFAPPLISEDVTRSTPADLSARSEPPEGIRIIDVEVQPASPRGGTESFAVEVAPEASTSAEDTGTPSQSAEPWTWDPTTAYRIGPESLLRQSAPAAPSLEQRLRALEAITSPAMLLASLQEYENSQERIHDEFRLGNDIYRNGSAAAWAEECRAMRFNDYWENYIVSDGDR